jgi:hypothetical protein
MKSRNKAGVISIIGATIATIILVGCVLGSEPVDAALTARDVMGTVEYRLESETQWQTVPRNMKLEAGQVIRTGPNSTADLVADDGSELYLDEETELAIKVLEYSKTEQKRDFKFVLTVGGLLAKALPTNFQTDTFDVATQTVVCGFKASSARIKVDQTGATDADIITGTHTFSRQQQTDPLGRVTVTYTEHPKAQLKINLPAGAAITTKTGSLLVTGGPCTVVIGNCRYMVPAETHIKVEKRSVNGYLAISIEVLSGGPVTLAGSDCPVTTINEGEEVLQSTIEGMQYKYTEEVEVREEPPAPVPGGQVQEHRITVSPIKK